MIILYLGESHQSKQHSHPQKLFDFNIMEFLLGQHGFHFLLRDGHMVPPNLVSQGIIHVGCEHLEHAST